MTISITDNISAQESTKVERKPNLGTFVGVFVPSILMVFGVIIFLRLGWIVGQAGLIASLAIISLSTLIALTTTLSMASISTNLTVGKGGVYYLLSRSLGIEIGSAIGVPLYLKQCLSIAFCVIGFAESLHDLMPAWSITSIGISTLLTLTVLAYFSLSGALKVQVVIFGIIICSLASLFMGGREMLVIDIDNYVPPVTSPLNFWVIFAIFFPAITGIESSVSLSGDLKNPSKSLPLGTISALIVAYIIYVTIAIFLVYEIPEQLLINDPFIMQAIAKIPAFIVLGIWGATISSALGGLLSAPRTLQALAEDGIVPKFLGKQYGVTQEPRAATLLTCLIALTGIFFGSVNIIAPMLTMICLICYAVLNLSAGLETLMDNPSWRPRFAVHWSISILGAAICLMAMIMISPGYAIVSVLFISLMYLMARRRSLPNSWEDIRQGILLLLSRSAIYNLANEEVNSKSWRPNFLVFAKKEEGKLLHFSQAITRNKGFITLASYVDKPFTGENERRLLQQSVHRELEKNKIHALVRMSYSEDEYVHQNMLQMIDNYGMGALTPNTIVCGCHKKHNLANLTALLRNAYQKQRNMIIFNSKEESIGTKIPSGDIHVWEHLGHKSNSEFMLVLAHMLQRNPEWKKNKIHLKKIVYSEFERAQAYEEARKASIEQRLQLEIEVLVSHSSESYGKFISQFSSDVSLVLLSLRRPQKEISDAEYETYLEEMMESVQGIPHSAFVLSSKSGPFDNILK
jgi:amino acid transporter